MSNGVGFVGTSAIRAAALVAFGWPEQLETLSLLAARSQAQLHAAVDGGPPVVLMQKEVSGNAVFEAYEVCNIAGDSPRERLGFSETAGIVDLITSILDSAHTHLRNAIDVGAGNKNVEIPSLRGIYQNLRKKNDKEDVFGKTVRARKAKKHVPSLAEIKRAHGAAMSRMKHIKTSLDKMLHGAKKQHAQAPPRGPTARTPHANTVPRASRVRQAPRVQQAPQAPSAQTQQAPSAKYGPGNPDPTQFRVAKQDVSVQGQIGGKKSTTTISAGSRYRLVPTAGGQVLMRVGQPPMVLSQGDAGRL